MSFFLMIAMLFGFGPDRERWQANPPQRQLVQQHERWQAPRCGTAPGCRVNWTR